MTYYYYKGETINLTINNNRFVVYFNTNMICLDTIKKRFTTGKELPLANNKPNNVYACEVVIVNNNYDSVRQSLANQNYIIDVEPVIGTDSTIMVSNLLYVKLKNANDYVLLENWANQTNSTIVRQSQYSSKWYVLEVSKQSSGSSIAVANILSQTDLFDKIDPGFVIPFRENTMPCVSDSAFNYQWGMEKINACDAWSITTGNPTVKIAVLDKGIDENHNDFYGTNVAGSFDTETGTQPAVIYGRTEHGTPVGGIIFANHNHGNIAGVAPNCSMLNISNSLDFNEVLSENLANGIYWAIANGADVINNSWGDLGGYGYNSLHSTYLEDALDSAIDYGRNGKGCVVVFAAGNSYPNMDYPATYRKEILTVGATDSNFIKCSFSATGLLLDVAAPGYEVLTTTSFGGWPFGNKNGTSIAAPHVAGLAGLILSVNNNLTGKQVRDIIEQTAQKVGPDIFVDYSQFNYNNGSWNPKLGYGFIDAYEAVKAALDYDLYTKDHSNDNGVEPSDIGNNGFYSPDIWVRRNRDGGTTHQEAVMGDTNYVYVKIHNNGSSLSSISDSIRLFMKRNITSANPVLSYQYWPSRWQQVAVSAIPPVPGNGEKTVCLPVKYDALFNSHTLLSRIESQNDLLSVPEVPLTLTNVNNNNNISIKNSCSAKYFLYDELGSGLFATALASEVSDYNPFKLRIRSTNFEPETNILDEAEVTVILSDNLAYYWQNNNIIPEGLKHIYNNTYLVENEDVVLDGFEVPEGYDADITLKYNFLTRKNTNNETYYNTIQRYNVIADDNDELVGGLTIQIDKPERLAADRFHANAGNDTAVLLNTTATLHATQINEDATYRWYDINRNFLYEGLNYSPATTTPTAKYILEVTADNDGYRDLDTVKVTVVPGCIRSITPNPVTDKWTTVSYEFVPTVSTAQLLIYNTATAILVDSYNNLSGTSLNINVSNYSDGSYSVVLMCDGIAVDSKVLIKQ